MKNFLFIFSFIAISQANAKPFHPCSGMACTPIMQKISAEYMMGSAINSKEIPFLASGECYHLSPNYKADHTHYGVALIDEKNANLYMGGIFAFFNANDPYADWTIEQAQAALPRLFDSNHILQNFGDYNYADMNPNPETPDVIMRYWLSQNESTLYVIGQWGLSHRIFCRYQSH